MSRVRWAIVRSVLMTPTQHYASEKGDRPKRFNPRFTAIFAVVSALSAHCGPDVNGQDASERDGQVEDRVMPRFDAEALLDAHPTGTVADVELPDASRDASLDASRDVLGTDSSTQDVLDGSMGPMGPMVDRSMPQLHALMFRANEADPMATQALGTQLAYLDTRVRSVGRLVVYLHGAGAPTTCGSATHQTLLASWGFHVLGPCYLSDYGVQNCGNDIGGCRLEAFDGVDHHPFVMIGPSNSIETRVIRALEWLQRRHPGGDWAYYLQAGRVRWDRVVISGISHGASTAGVIAQVRPVERAVMLSGPLDTGQDWLTRMGMTAPARLWGLSHTADPQHAGHLLAFASLMLPGAPTTVEMVAAPYAGSHRLISSLATMDGHGSTQAGNASPRDAMGRYRFEPVWRTMYGAP